VQTVLGENVEAGGSDEMERGKVGGVAGRRDGR